MLEIMSRKYQLLLLLTFVYTTTINNGVQTTTACPTNCTCSVGGVISLRIDCRNRASADPKDPGVLRTEIDELLTHKTYANLSYLNITHSSLDQVPGSLCRLSKLKDLYLDRNKLTRLPDGCLTLMPELVNLSATDNFITELQDGLFDGSPNLTRIYLHRNQISSIGVHVFSPTYQHNIEFVSLTDNCLDTLDVWPLALASKCMRREKRVQYHVANNNISKFTNNIRWRFNCSASHFSVLLSLTHNCLQHVVDLITGWNLTMEDFLCMIKRDSSKGTSEETARLDLKLRGNPLDCNCMDYQLYALEKFAYDYARIYRHTVCISPPSLRGRTILKVDLSWFECVISEKCPDRCNCSYLPFNKTLHVNCAYANISEVPRELPALPDASVKYKLNMSHNPQVRNFSSRPYFVNVSVIDVACCAIKKISFTDWEYLLGMQLIHLPGNSLRAMPKDVKKIKVLSEQIDIGFNPWKCYCENRWMKEWLTKNELRLVNRLSVYCDLPRRLRNKSMIQVDDEDFCSDPVKRQMKKVGIIIGCTMSVAGILTLVVGLVAHRLKYRMFARWRFHPFDRDECIGEEMNYDLFLSSSSEDQNEAEILIELLEKNGYKVCYHERDFEAGNTIENNISQAIERSKRTVCLITSSFICSPFCMREFEIALHHNVTVLQKKRLIVLMKLPNPPITYRPAQNNVSKIETDSPIVTCSLRQYLRQYTYVDCSAGDWFTKFLYTLPINGMLKENRNNNDEERKPLMHEGQPNFKALDNSDRSQFSSIHESAVGLSQLLNQTQRTSFATNRDVSTVPSPDSLAESRIGFDLPDNDADDRLDFGNEENGPVVSVPMQILSTNKL